MIAQQATARETRQQGRRRDILTPVGIGDCPDANAGLWLDKYYNPAAQPNEPKTALIVDAATLAARNALAHDEGFYWQAYQRWRRSLRSLAPPTGAGAVLRRRKANVQGRLVIGLGAEAILENAITLQRSYGVPYIPGSALKGLAAAYARRHLAEQGWGKPAAVVPDAAATWTMPTSFYAILFGDVASAGYVTFFDAWYVPGSASPGPLHRDVLTVHHQAYYGGGAAPADWDSPIPAPFLSATGEYLVALAGPQAWVDAAFTLLEWALRDEGIGAKTSSGYGRMEFTSNYCFPLDGRPPTTAEPEVDAPIAVVSPQDRPPTHEPQPQPVTPAKAPAIPPGFQLGTIKMVNPANNFGFILPDAVGKDVHFVLSYYRGAIALQAGMRVIFRVEQRERGPQARDVRPWPA